MKSRSFADLMAGGLAYLAMTGITVVLTRRSAEDARWRLPQRPHATAQLRGEDACRHCNGSGRCDACSPASCRVCRGAGLQPHDHAIVERLDALWNGVA